MGISFAWVAELVRYQSRATLLCFLGMTTHAVCLIAHAVCLLNLKAHAVSAAAVSAFKAQYRYCFIAKTTFPA